MLSLNANGHPVMRRFHKPGDEKRCVAVLAPDQSREWLYADQCQACSIVNPFLAEEFATGPSLRQGRKPAYAWDSNA